MTQGSLSAMHPPDDASASQAERDRALIALFPAHERVWLVHEYYDPVETIWIVTLVRRNTQGCWMRQRYAYDVPTEVIYFRGEQPISDTELLKTRREGKLLAPPRHD